MFPTPIEVNQLDLDLENPRNEPTTNQRDAMQALLNDQGQKLVNLAEDIVEHRLSPINLFFVMESDVTENRYIVLEGNRRLAALRLMANPGQLAELETESSIKSKFLDLGKRFANNPIESILAIKVDTREDADLWLERRHMGELDGVGTDDWDSYQKDRWDARRNLPRPHFQALEYYFRHSGADPKLKSQIAITTFQRVIDDPQFREAFGMGLENRKLYTYFPSSEVVKGMEKFISDLAGNYTPPGETKPRKLTVSDIDNKTLRGEYLAKFKPEDLPNPSKKTDQPVYIHPGLGKPNLTDKKEQKKNRPKKKTAPTYKRPNLIPGHVHLLIPQPRINNIFDELRNTTLNSHVNGVAVLFRVFLELSCDIYLRKNNLFDNKFTERKELDKKVDKVAHDLFNKSIIDQKQLEAIKETASDVNSVVKIAHLHSYVHNPDRIPTPRTLTDAWDAYQEFVEIIWGQLGAGQK